MIKVNNTFFRDTSANENLRDGLAVQYGGIVTERREKIYNKSGKDYLVEYIDAWGRVNTTWRGADEIELIVVDDADWLLLRDAIDALADDE